MRFAPMKRIFKLDRLRLRLNLNGAKDEVLLTAAAQNLRRLVKFLCRPPPSAAVPCAEHARANFLAHTLSQSAALACMKLAVSRSARGAFGLQISPLNRLKRL